MPRLEREVTINNRLGLHARAAAKLVTEAARFRADVKIQRGTREVSGKSIRGVMMLAAAKGTLLKLVADGEDAHAALDAVEQLIGRKFDEGE